MKMDLEKVKIDLERVKCAELLRKTGVPEKLINTPAIFEDCLKNYVKEENKEKLRARVKEDNEFSFAGTEYKLNEDNILEENYYDDYAPGTGNYGEVHIEQKLNEYGIAENYKYKSLMYGPLDFGLSSYYDAERKNGKVIFNKGNYDEKTEIDNGNIDLNVQEENMRNAQEKKKKNIKTILNEFNKNANETVKNYPNVKEYYDNLKREVISELKEEYLSDIGKFDADKEDINMLGITEEDYKRKIVDLTANLKDSNDKNKKLEKDNKSLALKLNRTLEFCEDVKNSKFGSLFFGRKIKKLNSMQEQQEER